MESRTITLNEVRLYGAASLPMYSCTEEDLLNETEQALIIARWLGLRPHGCELRLTIGDREYPSITNATEMEKMEHVKYCLDLDRALYNENNNLPSSLIS
jgi:hypothetical protein